MEKKNQVLDREAIRIKMKRMALEIAEQNIDENELLIAGINGNGEIVAQCLVSELDQIKYFSTRSVTIHLNKKEPLDVSIEPSTDFQNKVVLVVDDVANTGRTMLYALKPFLASYPKKIQTLVLVERSHKLFPIQTDYVGLSITTTLQEHIEVETSDKELTGALLF